MKNLLFSAFKRSDPRVEYVPAQILQDLFNQLNSSDIDYVLTKNILEELPNKLKNGKDIDILIHENHKSRFVKFMKAHNFKKKIHPYGKFNGWFFAYKVPEPHYWVLKSKNYSLFIDASFKLKCRSLTPKTWIPLDNSINEDIWKNKIFDKKNNIWILNDEDELVYLITRSVFDKKEFRNDYIVEIEKRKSFINNPAVKSKLSKIFFKYTDYLISQIERQKYENIVSNYLTFKNY